LYPIHPREILQDILENEREIKVMMINGDLDYHVNWVGAENLLKELSWYGNSTFWDY
jgi:carboxypeptidase C (cathepsin A)